MTRERQIKQTLESLGMYKEDEITIFVEETAMLVRENGTPVRAKDLKKGDKVLAAIFPRGRGRHFGAPVDEFIMEK